MYAHLKSQIKKPTRDTNILPSTNIKNVIDI